MDLPRATRKDKKLLRNIYCGMLYIVIVFQWEGGPRIARGLKISPNEMRFNFWFEIYLMFVLNLPLNPSRGKKKSLY